MDRTRTSKTERATVPFDSIDAAIDAIQAGKMVIVADDEDRENEGDLVCAASEITADHVNFMAKHGRGLICVALTPERADVLELPLMTDRNTDPQRTAFTVSVDAHQRFGVTTGISSHDRAHHDPGPRGLRVASPGSSKARPHLPPSLPARRRPSAGWAD